MVKRFNYDKTKFFKAIALLHEYQVGDEFYTLRDNKVIPVTLYRVEFTCYDHGLTQTCIRDLSIKIELICIYGGSSKMTIAPANLFRTREEAAEAFLDMNEIPKKLLQVLKPEKTNTTVGDLIETLKMFNPETELEDEFQKILDVLTRKYLKHIGASNFVFCSEGAPVQIVKADQKANSGLSPETKLYVSNSGISVDSETGAMGIGTPNKIETTSEYWDCNCPENYIHPASHTWCHMCEADKEDCPDSRVDEVNKMLKTKGKETI